MSSSLMISMIKNERPCDFWDMRANRQTNRHDTHHNIYFAPLPGLVGEVIKAVSAVRISSDPCCNIVPESVTPCSGSRMNSSVCHSMCGSVSIHAVKGKRLELSAPNSIDSTHVVHGSKQLAMLMRWGQKVRSSDSLTCAVRRTSNTYSDWCLVLTTTFVR